jgi:hypothetical protein
MIKKGSLMIGYQPLPGKNLRWDSFIFFKNEFVMMGHIYSTMICQHNDVSSVVCRVLQYAQALLSDVTVYV